MLEKYLQEIGLNEKEATIYLSLLAVDNSAVLDLAQKTKINRSTTYTVLESLAKKGLVSETTVGKKTHYHAEPPERLETYVEQRKVMLDEQSKKLKDIIPQIKSVQREGGEKPIVKYFEGKEGIISSLDELFESNEIGGEIYLVYPRDLLLDIVTKSENERYRAKRISRKMRSRVIYTYTNGEIPSDAMGDRIKIDQKKYPITCDISIYKDKIRIATLSKSLSGIFIRSQDLADTLRSLINFIHDTTGSIKKEESQS